jgi:MFS transporter, ACS family, pantothenate transporter
MVANASSGSQYFNLWLKAEKYSVVLVNTIPTAGSAIQVIASFLFGAIADFTGQRKHTANVVSLIVIVANILLSIWNIPRAALLFAFFLSYVGAAAQPIIIVSDTRRQKTGLGTDLGSLGDMKLRSTTLS